MIFEGLQVKHKALGNGVVTEKNGKYLTVRFDTASKVFVYPDVFEKFLTLADGTLNEEIQNDLAVMETKKQLLQDQKDQENLRAMTHGIVIPGKEIQPNGGDEDDRFKGDGEEA